MEKRSVTFGTYVTSVNNWTVSKIELSSPEYQSNMIQVPGRNGFLDLSTALTDGHPVYNSRYLTVVLENSDGDRSERESRIRKIISELDGYERSIRLPDTSGYYLKGRLRVIRNYNDMAHASVTVTAVCEPLMYSGTQKEYSVTASSSEKTVTIVNEGRMPVIPTIENTASNVSITFNGITQVFSTASRWVWSEMVLVPGSNTVKYSGSGTIKFSFTEAFLL